MAERSKEKRTNEKDAYPLKINWKNWNLEDLAG